MGSPKQEPPGIYQEYDRHIPTGLLGPSVPIVVLLYSRGALGSPF